jgi:hypothetical protein
MHPHFNTSQSQTALSHRLLPTSSVHRTILGPLGTVELITPPPKVHPPNLPKAKETPGLPWLFEVEGVERQLTPLPPPPVLLFYCFFSYNHFNSGSAYPLSKAGCPPGLFFLIHCSGVCLDSVCFYIFMLLFLWFWFWLLGFGTSWNERWKSWIGLMSFWPTRWFRPYRFLRWPPGDLFIIKGMEPTFNFGSPWLSRPQISICIAYDVITLMIRPSYLLCAYQMDNYMLEATHRPTGEGRSA